MMAPAAMRRALPALTSTGYASALLLLTTTTAAPDTSTTSGIAFGIESTNASPLAEVYPWGQYTQVTQVSPVQAKTSWVRDPIGALSATEEEAYLTWGGRLLGAWGNQRRHRDRPRLDAGQVVYPTTGGLLTGDSGFFYTAAGNALAVAGSVTTPTVYGGTGASDTLTLSSTSRIHSSLKSGYSSMKTPFCVMLGALPGRLAAGCESLELVTKVRVLPWQPEKGTKMKWFWAICAVVALALIATMLWQYQWFYVLPQDGPLLRANRFTSRCGTL